MMLLRRTTLLLALVLALIDNNASAGGQPAAQQSQRPVILFVHGAWGGGWQFHKIAPLLEARGYAVYRPTLTGLGERSHLATSDISLATHIEDIVNVILFENLHGIILVGHSYGGMVISGVADRLPDRIARLVYLDAFVPDDGDSVMALRDPARIPVEQMAKDGMIIPNWVKPGKPHPYDVPHPLRTFTDAISLKNPAARKIPATFILTVDPGKKPEDDSFWPAATRARQRGWPVMLMEADHNPHWRKPAETVDLLARCIENP